MMGHAWTITVTPCRFLKEPSPGLFGITRILMETRAPGQVLDGMSRDVIEWELNLIFLPLCGLSERVMVVRGRSVVSDLSLMI